MQIGRVVGSVVATQKDEKLAGLKLLLVQVLSHTCEPTDRYVVAGRGEVVLYATGSSARQVHQASLHFS